MTVSESGPGYACVQVGSSWEDQGSQNPYVQLARAQRLVDAAASSLAVLREQVWHPLT